MIAHYPPIGNHLNVFIVPFIFYVFLQKYNDLLANILNLYELYCILNLFFFIQHCLKDPYVLKFILVARVCMDSQGWAAKGMLR